MLTAQGQDANSALIVLSGQLRMERHVDTSNSTSDLGILHEGEMFGMQALLLGKPRAATLTVTGEQPAEVAEVTFASLALLVYDDIMHSPAHGLAQMFMQHVLEEDSSPIQTERARGESVASVNRIWMKDGECALLACPHQFLNAQARRGMLAASESFPRLLQVLLKSMPDIGPFEVALKVDIEVQTQVTLVLLHLVTKYPFALQAYESGLILPVLRLTSAPEPTVARNACAVVEGLLMNAEVCAAIGRSPEKSAGGTPFSLQEELGDLLVCCVIKKFKMLAAQHQLGDGTMLNCLKLLVQSPHTRRKLTAQLSGQQALRLLQSAMGNSGGTRGLVDTSGKQHYTAYSVTPPQINSVMSIMEGYSTSSSSEGDGDTGGGVMESEEAITWLERAVWQCQPPDAEITKRYVRMASR